MPNTNDHLSDPDLIMASDGELTLRRETEVRAHLEACRRCRERMHALEHAATEYKQSLDSELPSAAGPAALLRARLAEAAASPPARPAIWRLAPAAAVFVCILGAILIVFESKVSAEGPKPKAGLTPGETRPIDISEVCRTSAAEVVSLNITEETRREVFAAYGINPARRNEFEVDYLITPDLGGAESVRNMWPQPYSARWNARVKDKLEQRLHQLVCESKLDLTTAQHDIAVDWIGAYRKYVGREIPR